MALIRFVKTNPCNKNKLALYKLLSHYFCMYSSNKTVMKGCVAYVRERWYAIDAFTRRAWLGLKINSSR